MYIYIYIYVYIHMYIYKKDTQHATGMSSASCRVLQSVAVMSTWMSVSIEGVCIDALHVYYGVPGAQE